MYKIYINKTKIVLCSLSNFSKLDFGRDDDHLAMQYRGKSKYLLQVIDMAEKTNHLKEVVLYDEDMERLVVDFFGLYKNIEAGGGVVLNPNNKVLFIHRNGVWDLPKGKIEKGETRRLAAKREVKEETGIKTLQVTDKLLVTYHTYKNKSNKRCMKITHWYLMFGDDYHLIPQTEEGIDRVVWMTYEEFFAQPREVWPNIVDVLHHLKTKSKNT